MSYAVTAEDVVRFFNQADKAFNFSFLPLKDEGIVKITLNVNLDKAAKQLRFMFEEEMSKDEFKEDYAVELMALWHDISEDIQEFFTVKSKNLERWAIMAFERFKFNLEAPGSHVTKAYSFNLSNMFLNFITSDNKERARELIDLHRNFNERK